VPDQATADTLRAQLQADPSRYGAAAAQFPGPYTLPEVEDRALSEVPGPLAEQVAAASPNSAFTQVVEEVEGVIVTFVEGTVYPSFEELRPQLEQEFSDAADAAGASLVDAVREDLDVVVNPRYGDLDENGQLVPGDGGVVDILEDRPADGGADSSAPE
jgi:peptidyl-prolyl cis-trans isomerase SurA